MRTVLLMTAVVIGAVLSTSKLAMADPCGMVPPISAGQQTPITRVGLQQTYVFYKDGFTGKVDEFGMLIPFPTPPTLRKVPDHIFPHIAAAVDPPEVLVDLRQRFLLGNLRRGRNQTRTARQNFRFAAPAPDEVKVLKKEAVGMYEVAVLAAGSAKALNRWMTEHGFQYPKGMDTVCEDYIDQKWCFVAVKTKVGQKGKSDPKPGQRKLDTKLPNGSTFDGHVQGMGFRFETDELVVPMRLSAFNDGDLRNIVYLVTDKPQKIRSIPEEYVVRQVSGKQLVKNVTELLPLRIIGGTEKDIPEHRRRTLPTERNPVPHNGAAKELFAADLLAVESGQLSLPHEEQEKVMLRIGERFGLRGADIDKLNAAALAESRKKTLSGALTSLQEMTLTVVDGDFPRELLAKQNLTFAEYRMPRRRNTSAGYDAKVNKPGNPKQGILKLGALAPIEKSTVASSNAQPNSSRLLWLVAGLSLVGFVALVRSRRSCGN